MTPRSSFSRVARSVAVLAVAFLAGFSLRAIGSPDAPAQQATSPAVQGETAVDAPAVTATTSGPSRTEHGIPAGFERSEAGAVAAAATFVTTGQALLDMDPLAAEDAVRQMAATASADEQVSHMLDQLRGLRQVVATGTGPIVLRQAVVAYRVETFDPERARIAIWNVGVFAREGVAPPQAGWSTSTFELTWERDDWKVVDETVVPGPAPVLDDSSAPATARQLIAGLEGFVDFEGATP